MKGADEPTVVQVREIFVNMDVTVLAVDCLKWCGGAFKALVVCPGLSNRLTTLTLVIVNYFL